MNKIYSVSSNLYSEMDKSQITVLNENTSFLSIQFFKGPFILILFKISSIKKYKNFRNR